MIAAQLVVSVAIVVGIIAVAGVAIDAQLDDDALLVRLARCVTVSRIPYARIEAVDVVSVWRPSWEPGVNLAARFWGSIVVVHYTGGLLRVLRISPPDPENFAAQLRLRAAAAKMH